MHGRILLPEIKSMQNQQVQILKVLGYIVVRRMRNIEEVSPSSTFNKKLLVLERSSKALD